MASARAQAFYGMATTPLLAGGRIPLRLALLSPAGRPIAVTADLAASGKAPGPTRAATCAAAIPSTTGRTTAPIPLKTDQQTDLGGCLLQPRPHAMCW